MTKFTYNNVKNINKNLILVEQNYRYHPYVLMKKRVDLCSKSQLSNKLSK